MNLPKVLVVEDLEQFHDFWGSRLEGKVTLVSAFSIREAQEQFAQNPDVVAIVMDACVPGNAPTTQPLVRKLRETFTGPIIATSSLPEYRQELLRAGCDHECEQEMLPQKLCDVLGLSPL